MRNFKEIISNNTFNKKIFDPSVSLRYKNHELFLKINTKDVITEASYSGEHSPWYSALCFLIIAKDLNQCLSMTWQSFEEAFRDDAYFWDLRSEETHSIIFGPLELLHATLDKFRGRDYLYDEQSALVCRCFGVRESDILHYLQSEENPTLEGLGVSSKAGMGCRSCLVQLERMFKVKKNSKNRFYKNRPVAEWLIMIDEVLKRFPKASEWKMEVESFQNNLVIIKFDKQVSQKEEEEVGSSLQGFLAEGVDLDLAFFLRRS
ncbi:MAG: (2Fe-2S)-binding protein [Bacteriovoracaceae bacterium]